MSAKATLNRLEPKIIVLGHADEEIQDKAKDRLTVLEDKDEARLTVLEDKVEARLTVLEDKVEARLTALEDKVEARLTVLEDKVEWIHKYLINGIKRINNLRNR